MVYRNFDEMIDTIKSKKQRRSCAVVSADSENVLKAVFRAYHDGFIEPILIGDEGAVRGCLENIGEKDAPIRIMSATSDQEAAQKAVELARDGDAEILMKGSISTARFFSPLLDKKNGLKPKRALCSFALFEIPTYHKLIATSDAGILLYPTLEQKKFIIENAVAALRWLGNPCPKVAVLAALETATPKMPETMDAAELQKMNERGEIKDCIVAGPISYDLAINGESAKVKGYDHPVAGDADLLVFPNVTSGNMVTKSLVYSAGALVGMFAIGVKPTVVFGSRSSGWKHEYVSLVIASGMGRS